MVEQMLDSLSVLHNTAISLSLPYTFRHVRVFLTRRDLHLNAGKTINMRAGHNGYEIRFGLSAEI